ncbi:hypothetical protein O181_098287 [Austropuccinia psidii MF-1]|uniref:DUF4219 domain-containing protein n=1 Tax=Austropuccinia psidii MF-1 TaxID=1389203 RepID=A0A9Q3JAY0_9BASI|nr:hypothetical protein [Austropuccinia psidii MF-1]
MARRPSTNKPSTKIVAAEKYDWITFNGARQSASSKSATSALSYRFTVLIDSSNFELKDKDFNMNNNDQNNDLRKIIPILTDDNYSEWKLRMIISLKQRRLYQYCIKHCVPGDGETQTPAVEAKVVDANVEACGIITNFLDSRTFAALVTSEEITQNSFLLWNKVNERFASSSFNSKAPVWSRFEKLIYEENLKDFITNTQKCLGDIASVVITVEDEILAFSILTKLPEEFHLLIEKVTLNADTKGNPDTILNVLHEASLKEEALSYDSTKALVLKKDEFPSKIVHYCSNGRHNPLVTMHTPKNAGNYILN